MIEKLVFGRGGGGIGWCQMKMEMVITNLMLQD